MDLIVLLNGAEIGLLRSTNGKPQFRYRQEWQEWPGAIPLSLSLPLSRDDHDSETVANVLWGVLPDNERILTRWGQQFHVSARNPVALLSHIGEDCAGAVQFVRPERLDALLSGAADDVEWLDEDAIEQRLRQLREQAGTTGRRPGDIGQFSLAGAQPKTALLMSDGRWGIPAGRIPTTHILKPPTGEFDGFVENEHFCLSLARALAIPAATSEVVRFGDEVAICVERYDQVIDASGEAIRVHQEDFCQALGVHPENKYQNFGGPGPSDIFGLLNAVSSSPREDINTFFMALALNWLIAGPDAHAKNYSILLGATGQARLAPLYDVASAFPHPEMNLQKVKLAMKVGSHYRWRDISIRDWERLINEAPIADDLAWALLSQMAEQLPDYARDVRREMEDSGLTHPAISRLEEGIASSCARARRLIGARS